MDDILGIDIGGSGIKGAPVNLRTGEFSRDRLRVPTPDPAKPKQVMRSVAEIVHHFELDGPVGVTFPGVVIDGTVHTAANLVDEWVGLKVAALFEKEAGVPVTLMNDADAAGVAEMSFGAGRGRRGTVLMVTLGTGIGSALFVDGELVPNTELGHIEIDGKDGETRASSHAREVHDWTWEKWAKKLSKYLRRVEALCWPSLIIVGGGVSKEAEEFLPLLKGVRADVVPAELHNAAGIVGAAMAAAPRGPAA
jgi:polyphosphate glucokinase